jgi:hypothetical protein
MFPVLQFFVGNLLSVVLVLFPDIIIIIIIMESKAKLKGPWSQRRLLLLLMNKWIELN